MTRVVMNDKSFVMANDEWGQTKTWLLSQNQEKAMRWWSNAFDSSFAEAVGILNRVQIVLQYGTEEQKNQMVSNS